MLDENELENVRSRQVETMRPPHDVAMQGNATAPENNYIPAGDDYLNDYLDEIEIPKQEQPAPELPDDSEFEETETVDEGPLYSKQQFETSKVTAFFVVKTIDELLSTGIAVYAMEPDAKTFQATRDELNEISQHLSVYFAENSFNLPPWAMAAIPATMVIGRKFNMAGKLRKANLEKKQAENELKEVRRELERLQMEKEIEKTRNEVSKLKHEQPDN